MLWEDGTGGGGVLRTSTGRMNFGMYCNTSALCGHMMWGLTTLKKYFRFCQLTASNCFDNFSTKYFSRDTGSRRDFGVISRNRNSSRSFLSYASFTVDYSHSDILYTGLKHFSFFLSLFFLFGLKYLQRIRGSVSVHFTLK